MIIRTAFPRVAAGIAGLLFALTGCTAPAASVRTEEVSSAEALLHVDPELRSMAVRNTVLTDEQVQKARALPPPAAPPQDPPYVEKTIRGLEGQPDVSIIVVNARPGEARPGILHTHGGGYVLGSARQYLPLVQKIAKALDVTVVTVEYRLAPETTYKGSVQDNYAALKWMHDHASELGVDIGRLAVMGESAGGGHAALLAIEARNRGEVPLSYQVLLYPMLDDRTGSSRQPAPHAGRFIWTAANNRLGWRSFLGVEPGTDQVPAEAVPARLGNVSALPPAYIAVGDIDLFVEEDVSYAHRLIEAGVPVELHVFRGGYHAFNLLLPNAAVSKQFDAALLDALRRGLRIPS
ncbi:MAG: alpha/beta hydrolase [Hyphomonadaceae bacterium]